MMTDGYRLGPGPKNFPIHAVAVFRGGGCVEMPPGVYSADDFAANCQSPATSPGHCPTPTEPGYYWAKWKIASPGTFENDDFKPSNQWETVEVWFNGDVPDHPEERLGVSVPGVRETQWVDQFYWGPRINPPT